MEKKVWIGTLAVACMVVSSWALPGKSSAVPSFARQTGKSCSGCHTIWPRLNATGREFKLTGYTDVAEDYQRIVKDNLDLLRYSPLSLSIINLPYSWTSGGRSETFIPDEVALFYAGRISPNIGAFVEPILAPEFEFEFAKLAAATRWGSNTVGIVAGKMDVAGADPYNTIRFTAYHTINQPAIFSQPDALSGERDFFSFVGTGNRGVVIHGKFFQTVYAAVGGFRGHATDDSGDVFARLAAELPIGGEANISVGGFSYTGKERYDHSYTKDVVVGTDVVTQEYPLPEYKSKIARYGADVQYQMESGPNIIDVVAVYMAGKDSDIDQYTETASPGPGLNVKFTSYYVEASYFFERMYGVTVGFDDISSDEDPSIDKSGPTYNITYLPWPNTKFALEYSAFKLADSARERTVNFLLHLYF